ncbi:adenosylcobinamide amidohydrolase [uncultured Sulfitobacter sp.]|uniref:adenosylcobinamide amidohydrolase n=1 Tax=uncultured Sulfitobacter sp. TaxID=191468 RepID=UPI0026162E2E|nr:adenosylcobinamide amidohydrolase [uncultured Sulfitobacter sp.]
MSNVTLARPWLTFDLGAQMQVLSWAVNRPGFVMSDRIVWREVRNADLPRDLDVVEWFTQQLAERGDAGSVAFLTSRDVTFYSRSIVTVGQTTAQCLATVGLSNAERVGHRMDRSGMDWGTINVALKLDTPLSQTGLIETMSIATQARTTAVIDAAFELSTGVATGTGTDCIAVAAPPGKTDYAGLHTEVGEAAGAAVYRATFEGAQQWKADVHPQFIGKAGYAGT